MRDHSVIMIAPLSSPSARTRLAKMVQLMGAKGLRVCFFGWQREKKETYVSRSGILEIATILRGGGYGTRKARMMYPLWMMVVFWCVLRLGRGQTIFCLGWETAFPARLAAALTGARIVFDDADRFSMLVRLPAPFHGMLQRLERWTSFHSAVHVVPGFSRYEWQHGNMMVLRNTPLQCDLEAAWQSAPERPRAALVLYANGWIGETRGAPVLLDVLRCAAQKELDLQVVIAGRVDGPSAKRLLESNLVTYLGEVEQSKALSWYSAVDLLLTFYDPAIAINRKAESNKWGDAVYFDTPFIVNSEVETARPFVERGAAFSIPYADTKALFQLLEDLVRSPERVLRAKTRVSSFKSSFPVFDEGLTAILCRQIRGDK